MNSPRRPRSLWGALPVRCAVAALAAAAATALASAPLELTWTPFVCLAPLLRCFAGQGWRRSFLIGWCAGAGANLGLFTWLGFAFRDYGALHPAVAVLLFAIYVLLMGLQYGLLGLFDCAARRAWPRGRLWVFPAAFVAVELLWPRLFPWHVSTPLVVHPHLTLVAEWGGQLALTFVVVAVNVGLYALVTRRTQQRAALAGWGAALLVLTLIYGAVRVGAARAEIEAAPRVRVAVVQPAVVRNLRHDVSPAAVRAALVAGAREAQAGGAQLTVFSEGSVPRPLFTVADNPAEPLATRRLRANAGQASAVLSHLARTAKSPVLAGGGYVTVRASSSTNHAEIVDQHNAVFQVDAKGELVDRYDKHVLLPFAEYLPGEESFAALRDLLPVAGRMSPGPGPRLLEVQVAGRDAPLQVAPLVCYEGVSPSVVRSTFAETTPDVLINGTNDVWFSAQGPHLHRMIVLWRAVETGRPIVRVTSTGLSVTAFPDGSFHGETSIGEQTTRLVDVPLLDGDPAPYVRVGELFGWVVTLLGAGLILFGRTRRAS